jgi:hypothetical protein
MRTVSAVRSFSNDWIAERNNAFESAGVLAITIGAGADGR